MTGQEESGSGNKADEVRPLVDKLTGVEQVCSELKCMMSSLSQKVATMPSVPAPWPIPSMATKKQPSREPEQVQPQSHAHVRDAQPIPKQHPKKSFAEHVADAANTDEDWSRVGPRKKRAQFIKGTTETSGRFQGAPEPKFRDIFVYRVSKDCETDDIKTMLMEKNCEVHEICVMSNEAAKNRSFKITVKPPVAALMLSDTFPWPCGVRVRRFFQRPRGEEKKSFDEQS